MRGARRGFLGLLGGGGAAALMGNSKANGGLPTPYYGAGVNAVSGGGSGPSQAQWKLLHSLQRPREKALQRTEMQRALTGGWPPGVVCMESNAPWFRAMVAAKRIQAERDEAEGWFEALRRKILGEWA